MSKTSSSRAVRFIVLGTLVILACQAVQFDVQININLTPTSPVNDFTQNITHPAVLQTPTITSVPPTGTPSATPEPMSRLLPGQTVQIGELIMLGEMGGWGIEPWGHILHTLDEGRTWRDVTPPQNSIYKRGSFYTSDPNIAWAVSVHSVELTPWYTSDAGRFWTAGEPIDLRDIDAGACGPLTFDLAEVQQVFFIDSVRGWMVVRASAKEHAYDVSMLFSTADEGSHWELRYLSTRNCSTGDGPEGLRSVLFRTPNDGWGGFIQYKFGYYPYNQERYVGGWDIYRTRDAGGTWEQLILPDPPGFLAETTNEEHVNLSATCGITEFVPLSHDIFGMKLLCFIPDTQFYYYYLTFNNGLDWTVWESSGSEEFVVDPYRDYKTTGWRFLPSTGGGLSEIQQTFDRGQTWTTIKKVAWKHARLDFVSEQVGWAIVTINSDTMLLNTTNGGRSWKLLSPVVAPDF